jgi:hypothetical protein
MKTYEDVDEFIADVLPLEFLKIMKQKKSPIDEFIEKADAEFEHKLAAILEGKMKDQTEEKTENKQKQDE